MQKLKVMVVGCGNMGTSHAKAFHSIEDYQICAIVDKFQQSREKLNNLLGGGYPLFEDVDEALKAAKPDVVAICTYPETHEPLAIKAMEAGCHVFVEKPLATSVEAAERVAEAAKRLNRKVVVGYILHYHPSWKKFVELSKTLGKPLVMRMNLNQQSHGFMWNVHKNLMKSSAPIVDCGVHYVDIMCQMTGAKPVSVSAIGARLSDQIDERQFNYGQLQVRFDDGSVGWYEAGWGPMASTNAFFVKDVWGPNGCVSIEPKPEHKEGKSDNVDSHTKTDLLRVHYAQQDENNEFVKKDEFINTEDEPTHDELCRREQEFLLDAIRNDVDLTDHLNSAIESLRIVLAADESAHTGKTVEF